MAHSKFIFNHPEERPITASLLSTQSTQYTEQKKMKMMEESGIRTAGLNS